MNYPNEWTQEEYLKQKNLLNKNDIEVILIDTILAPIEKAKTITYNPFEMEKYKEGTVFVFYCDTGKATLNRLNEYRKKFPKYHCISLKGGKGYYRTNMMILDEK